MSCYKFITSTQATTSGGQTIEIRRNEIEFDRTIPSVGRRAAEANEAETETEENRSEDKAGTQYR